ncbi:MAG TPA: hypothetical protein VFH95_00335 [Candidatus Kapabacteria bacterium]|nr:hypothetical protein [Candidatus Kapabacteria bacterium]
MKKLAKKDDRPSVKKVETIRRQDECLTALPATIDVAALAALYNSPTSSPVAHEYLLEEARRALGKYELAQADLELAADSLARAMHMLVEQHGLKKLPPERMAELERDVLEWFGLCPPEAATKSASEPKLAKAPVNDRSSTNAGKKHSNITRHKPDALVLPHTTLNAHGTSLSH